MKDPITFINEATNLSKITQIATGFSLPPIIPLKQIVTVKNADTKEGSEKIKNQLTSGLVENTNWIIPLTFKADGFDDFKFPLDPIISLSSKNIITRRYVSKSKTRGSIKERWSQDDWEISITGVVISANGSYPKYTIAAIREFCDVAKSVDVVCELFNEMGINRISIENIDFPFTKGEENQAFVIKAYSDEDYDLLIKN